MDGWMDEPFGPQEIALLSLKDSIGKQFQANL